MSLGDRLRYFRGQSRSSDGLTGEQHEQQQCDVHTHDAETDSLRRNLNAERIWCV